VYAVTDRQSFDMIKKIHERLIFQTADENLPRILVGTKSDEASTLPRRQVSKEEGENLAKELGVEFVETSAMTGDGIDPELGPSAFVKLINRIDSIEDVDEVSVGCLEMCSCCPDAEDEVGSVPSSLGSFSLGYVGSFLTFLIGISLVVMTVIMQQHNYSYGCTIQQWVLMGVGFMTLVASVLATVGVQKRSATLNKIHLGFMVIVTLLNMAFGIWGLVVSMGCKILAIANLCLLALELPVVAIACHRAQEHHLSFLEPESPSSSSRDSSLRTHDYHRSGPNGPVYDYNVRYGD